MNVNVRILTHNISIILIVLMLHHYKKRAKREAGGPILGTFENFWEKMREKNVQNTAKKGRKNG